MEEIVGRPLQNATTRNRPGFKYLGIDLSVEIFEALRLVAQANEETITQICRRIFRDWFNGQPANIQRASLLKQLEGQSVEQQRNEYLRSVRLLEAIKDLQTLQLMDGTSVLPAPGRVSSEEFLCATVDRRRERKPRSDRGKPRNKESGVPRDESGIGD